MTRVCVFCGGSPTSLEHLWPHWAGRVVAESGARSHHQRTDRQGHEPEQRTWPAPVYSSTVGAVCEPCNSGWMSRLETDAKPLLEPMLRGRGRELHETGQRTLATWALKTALMFQQSQKPARRTIPRSEYEHLHGTGEPSDRVRVWMATYTGDMPGFVLMYGADLDPESQDEERGARDIYGATVTMGPVVFQLYGSTLPGVIDHAPVPAVPYVHQLWPYEDSFTWAPSPALDDGGLAAFANELFEDLVRLSGSDDNGSSER